MKWRQINEIKLENHAVLLRPISADDREGFKSIAFEPEIWRYFVSQVLTETDLDGFIRSAVEDAAAGRRVVFCIVSKADGRTAGSMAYGNLAESEKRLEIGWSWLGQLYRGTKVNWWSKYLLLEHAFESLECERVEFKTDVLNARARRGLEKIGAVEEGVLRSYNYMPGNRRRDAVYYSILKREWPGVRARLLQAPA